MRTREVQAQTRWTEWKNNVFVLRLVSINRFPNETEWGKNCTFLCIGRIRRRAMRTTWHDDSFISRVCVCFRGDIIVLYTFIFCLFGCSLHCFSLLSLPVPVQNHKYLNSEMRAHKAGLWRTVIIEYVHAREAIKMPTKRKKQIMCARLSVLNFSAGGESGRAHKQTLSCTVGSGARYTIYTFIRTSFSCTNVIIIISITEWCDIVHIFSPSRIAYARIPHICWVVDLDTGYTIVYLPSTHTFCFCFVSFQCSLASSFERWWAARMRPMYLTCALMMPESHSKCDDCRQTNYDWVNINKLNRVHDIVCTVLLRQFVVCV